MALYVYEAATGRLESWSLDDDAPVAGAEELAAKGLASIAGLASLDETHAWDASTREVIEVAPPYKPFMISVGVWILRFTPEEYDAITSSQDKRIRWLLYALNNADDGAGRKVIDLNSNTVKNGVAYMESLGLLAQDRVTAILATD